MRDLRILSELQRFLLRHLERECQGLCGTGTPACAEVSLGRNTRQQGLSAPRTTSKLGRQNHLSLYPVTADPQSNKLHYRLDHSQGCTILRLGNADSTNILSRAVIASLQNAVENLKNEADNGRIKAFIITGNVNFFSAGADLKEIAKLKGPTALEFARAGQRLMRAVDFFPV